MFRSKAVFLVIHETALYFLTYILEITPLAIVLQAFRHEISGHIFGPIFIDLGQSVCLYEIADEFNNGSFGVKN